MCFLHSASFEESILNSTSKGISESCEAYFTTAAVDMAQNFGKGDSSSALQCAQRGCTSITSEVGDRCT